MQQSDGVICINRVSKYAAIVLVNSPGQCIDLTEKAASLKYRFPDFDLI